MATPKTKIWICDFETTCSEEDKRAGETRVWLWAARDIYSEDHKWGTSIDTFMDFIFDGHPKRCGFHNLKFDGNFITSFLLSHFYQWREPGPNGKTKILNGEFTSIISDMGQWYSMKIGTPCGRPVEIIDTLKLLPFKVSQIAKDFHLPMLKGEIDYQLHRPEGWQPTEEELQYIFNDVDIVALAIKEMYTRGMNKLTIGACALSYFKDMTPDFLDLYPVPEYDHDIRQGYRGGWTYCNPLHAGEDIGEGIVLDVNSLYPAIAAGCHGEVLPYGAGVWEKGEVKATKVFPCVIQRMSCRFELKKGHLPSIQIKDNPFLFGATDYLVSSKGEVVDLVVTNVDLDLMREQYDLYDVEYHNGWKFRGKVGLFKEYVEFWTKQKVAAKKAGNFADYILSKLMLNSLIGKFGKNPKVGIKRPELDEKGIVRYKDVKQPLADPVYLPTGMFVTSYGRAQTLRAAQAVFPRYLYSDTDSIHLMGLEIPEELEVDPYKLGAWDHEATFKRGRYLHAKCYFEDIYTEWDEKKQKYVYTNKVTDTTAPKVTIAGLPADCHGEVTWENFHFCKPSAPAWGTYSGKKKPSVVKGGVILEEIPFVLKELTAHF